MAGQGVRGAHPDRGAGTVLAIAAVMALVTIAAIGCLGLSYATAARSVRAAADVVALSAAQRLAAQGDACAEAGRVAARNEVSVQHCQVAGDAIDFAVEVQVSRDVGWRLPGLPAEVSATAYAGKVTGAG